MLTILLAIIAAILVVLGPRFITTIDPARQDLAQAVRQECELAAFFSSS